MRLLLHAMIVALLLGGSSGGLHAQLGEPQIWLGPRAPAGHSAGISDWAGLFAPDAPWGGAARRTDVLDFNAEHMGEWPADKIAAEVAAVRKRGIRVGMTTMPLPRAEGSCGEGVEGYDLPDGPQRSAARLKAAGIAPDYLTLDGPMIFGRYFDGPTACRSSVKTVAEQSAATIRTFAEAFPGIEVGVVESAPAIQQHPNWRQEYAAFLAGVEAASGRRISYLALDVNWRNPGTAAELPELAAFARSHGLRLGIIYNGDDQDGSDAAWTAHARQNFDLVEGRLGLIPDMAIFDSWNDSPRRAMPDTDPSSLTGVLASYLLPRTSLSAAREGTAVRGRLTRTDGAPAADEQVEVSRLGADRTRPLPVRSIEGRAPPDARSALLGWRINDECNCTGANDLLLDGLRYQEVADGDAQGGFDMLEEARASGRAGGVKVAVESAGGEPVLHVQLAAGQALQATGKPFPVTAGAAYRLSAPLASIDGGGLFGYATVIFLDALQHGITRGFLTMDATEAPVATARTDADGRFEASLPAADRGACLRVTFAATERLRGSARDLPCGGA